MSDTIVFQIPPTLNDASVFGFVQAFQAQLRNPKSVVFDFSTIEWANPFGALILAEEIKVFAKERNRLDVGSTKISNYSQKNAATYLQHIGFFQLIGPEIGNPVGALQGNSNYMPTTELCASDFKDDPDNPYEQHPGDKIERKAEQLAQQVTKSRKEKEVRPLAYAIREIVRNVFEHGETDRCLVCSQGLASGKYEFAILDRGIGISKSLEAKFGTMADGEALSLSLKPGVTKASQHEIESTAKWSNSGYGLYLTSQMGARLGSFLAVSGGAGLSLIGDAETVKAYQFQGTAIKLEIQRPFGVNFEDFHNELIEEGKELASSLGYNPKPSRSSSSLVMSKG